jgi:hypothetical protein
VLRETTSRGLCGLVCPSRWRLFGLWNGVFHDCVGIRKAPESCQPGARRSSRRSSPPKFPSLLLQCRLCRSRGVRGWDWLPCSCVRLGCGLFWQRLVNFESFHAYEKARPVFGLWNQAFHDCVGIRKALRRFQSGARRSRRSQPAESDGLRQIIDGRDEVNRRCVFITAGI